MGFQTEREKERNREIESKRRVDSVRKMSSEGQKVSSQRLFDNLTNSEANQLYDSILGIEKNMMKYLTERYFSKGLWHIEWNNRTLIQIKKYIDSLKYTILDVSKAEKFTEYIVQSEVGYIFSIIVS